MLPSFAGKPSERNHAAALIDRLKRYLELQPRSTDARKLKAVTNFFPINSAAGAWILAPSRNCTTFADFESAIASRLGTSDTVLAYSRKQFRRFRQRESDSRSKICAVKL